MNGLGNNRKGTTMVEILVVMVILLVGIMTVIMMFPSGFRVVRAAESQTIATKLAQAEVERWKNMPGNLPDGILPTHSDGTPWSDQYPGPGFEGFTGPAGETQYETGNALSCRSVDNEPVGRLSPGTYFTCGDFYDSGSTTVYGSRYQLGFCPIETDGASVRVKSGNLLRRVGDSDSFIYLRPGQYGIDYALDTTGANPAFHINFGRDTDPTHVYFISYSYWIGKTTGEWTLISMKDQVVYPEPNGNHWRAVEVSVPSTYPDYEVTGVEEGTDSCARGFHPVTPVPTAPNQWSPNDPYEFALVDPILGIVALNPLAGNASEYTASGVRPITARISYRIYDPRIIREDKVIGALNEDIDNDGTNDHTSIKLALRFVLNMGDSTDNPDEPAFEGLVKNQLGMVGSPVVVPQSLLIIDIATGLRVSMTDVIMTPEDYKHGVVHLPAKADLIDWAATMPPVVEQADLVGRHLRFFYRADGDWSVQCQKAYSYYLREWDAPLVDYRHFKLRAQTGELLFAKCDSGKNVTVDYSYLDSNNTARKVVGKTFRISDDITSDPVVKLDIPPGAFIDQAARIVVVGASFRARVIWRDGKAWRFVDIDTNLTRNSSP